MILHLNSSLKYVSEKSLGEKWTMNGIVIHIWLVLPCCTVWSASQGKLSRFCVSCPSHNPTNCLCVYGHQYVKESEETETNPPSKFKFCWPCNQQEDKTNNCLGEVISTHLQKYVNEVKQVKNNSKVLDSVWFALYFLPSFPWIRVVGTGLFMVP